MASAPHQSPVSTPPDPDRIGVTSTRVHALYWTEIGHLKVAGQAYVVARLKSGLSFLAGHRLDDGRFARYCLIEMEENDRTTVRRCEVARTAAGQALSEALVNWIKRQDA